ncbi:MAG: hypothetical protein CMJ75_14190 [Planctomycetaceae bacterium]|nr:hypothetical protein [Planctomycetaceae bacterium]
MRYAHELHPVSDGVQPEMLGWHAAAVVLRALHCVYGVWKRIFAHGPAKDGFVCDAVTLPLLGECLDIGSPLAARLQAESDNRPLCYVTSDRPHVAYTPVS